MWLIMPCTRFVVLNLYSCRYNLWYPVLEGAMFVSGVVMETHVPRITGDIMFPMTMLIHPVYTINNSHYLTLMMSCDICLHHMTYYYITWHIITSHDILLHQWHIITSHDILLHHMTSYIFNEIYNVTGMLVQFNCGHRSNTFHHIRVIVFLSFVFRIGRIIDY